jgi:hypothetical protein
MKKLIIIAVVWVFLLGCNNSTKPLHMPETSGEIESGYTYIPLDPVPIKIILDDEGKEVNEVALQSCKEILHSLPDNAMRMLVEHLELSGNVKYGISETGIKGESYRVTIDYINSDTVNIPFRIAKMMRLKDSDKWEHIDMLLSPGPKFEPGTEAYRPERMAPTEEFGITDKVFYIPVYIGVGLRVSSNIHVTGASANISGIGIIGAEAEAGRLKGSLVVQTLGINGESIAAALPIQSELNRTTAQNAIVAISSIKSLLYTKGIIKTPRVVGLHLPFHANKSLINTIVSELSKEPIKWKCHCRNQDKAPRDDSD